MKKLLIHLGLAATLLGSASSAFASAHLSQSWKLHKLSDNGVVVTDTGTVHGSPFGTGDITVKTSLLKDGMIALRFNERLAHGSLTGTVRLGWAFNAAHTNVHYRGAGRLTGGTGTYAHARWAIHLDGTGFPSGAASITIRG